MCLGFGWFFFSVSQGQVPGPVPWGSSWTLCRASWDGEPVPSTSTSQLSSLAPVVLAEQGAGSLLRVPQTPCSSQGMPPNMFLMCLMGHTLVHPHHPPTVS